MIRQFAPYDAVAEDYYDSVLHPTCENFRSLSRKFLEQIISDDTFRISLKRPIIETGCGKSLLCEIADSGLIEFPENLTIQDQSEKMISHSVRWQNSLRDIFISDARNMPLGKASLSGAFSFLADPYNDQALWKEISRVLAPTGIWIVTVPSHAWAARFREPDGLEVSRFVTAQGTEHDLPSYTYAPKDLVGGASNYGLALRRFRSFNISEIEGSISGKLRVGTGGNSILDCYAFEREP